MGVYRVHYSPDMLESLISAIGNMELSARDRLGIQNDLFALVTNELTSCGGEYLPNFIAYCL